VKRCFILPDPCGQLLFDDLPDAVFALHSEYDPVAAVVADVYGEQAFLQPVGFTEIEFPQTAVGLHQLGELNIPDKLYLHKDAFEYK